MTQGRTGPTTPEQRRLIDVGVAYWRRTAPADAPLGVELLPDDDAVVVSHTVRGGGRIYVASDESVLFAGSAVPPHEAIEVFRSGRRTPPEHFRPRGRPASAAAAEDLFTPESLPRLQERLSALAGSTGLRRDLLSPPRGDQLLHLGDFETWHDLVRADDGYAVRRTDRGVTQLLGTATHVEDAARFFVVACGFPLRTDGLSAAELRRRIPPGVHVAAPDGGVHVVEWTDGERRRVTVRSDQRAYPFAAAIGRSLDAMLSAGPAR
ncbi:hypothetical protein [Streptomyces sp. NPDC005012]|uniref:hypothetical protein n=1 Tax=Streptomyces sp. NPDC005012 TaxID=3154558 RepID=UPI0033AE3B33